MARTTIDFGIDLGTTNSAIAVLRGTVTDILKNNQDTDITPSAVHMSADGRLQVGTRARNRLEDERAAGDVYVEFKRRMGTDHLYRFASSGLTRTPEELSAEVLKCLRGDVQQRLGEELGSAVITVPAAFEQRQCAATKRAGESAGLGDCPLVQEPVAAALAYGFQVDASKEYWMVYDFGGGTFDAALLRAHDGIIDVVNHGGDNYLGGSDFDWAIVDRLVVPRLADEYRFPDFHRRNAQWRGAFAMIKRAVEVAKIELSRSETSYLGDGGTFRDANGNEVSLDLKLTRDEIITVAEPFILRSVEICRRVLAEKHLGPGDVSKILLVGGPTLAPYFRDILKDRLGIELEASIDPLTVVARGAAVFAGTQPLLKRTRQAPVAGECALDLKYNPVGPDTDPVVRGRATAANGAPLEGHVIQFRNEPSKWDSGKIPVRPDGSFRAQLSAERGRKNEFIIQLFDGQGRQVPTVPNSVAYTVGTTISEQPVINSLGVALANNEFDVFFPKGTPLPAKATKLFRTAQPLKRGATGDLLKIPVVEGENERADRNRLQNSLTVPATNIRRDLPAGAEVEVTLTMDESRSIRAKAYIPLLDEEFDAVIDPESRTPDTNRLKQEMAQERQRLQELREKELSGSGAMQQVAALEEVEDLVERSDGDSHAANKAEARLLELRVALDSVENATEWPRRVKEATEALEHLMEVAGQFGNDDLRRRAAVLREEVEVTIAERREDRLPKKIAQVQSLSQEILASRHEFWVFMFQQMQEQRAQMKDGQMAARLFQHGQACLQRGDAEALKQVVLQLFGLLPSEVAEAVQRGYGSGLVR